MPNAFKTKSPSLPELQRWMRGVLTDRRGVSNALAGKEGPRYLHVIGETPELKKAERLSIYGDGYFLRLVDCLGANYEAVKNVLGPDLFDRLGRDYLDRFPSRFKCIDDVGAELPVFIKRHAVSKGRPFLPDLALLEWTVHEAMYADDVPPLKPEKLAALPPHAWPRAKLVLDPSVRLLTLNWPVDDLWRADGKWTASKLKRLRAKKTVFLVYRRDDKLVRAPRLSEAQHELLASLKAGRSLGKSLSRLSKTAAPPPVQRWFTDWAARGVIRDVC